MVKAFHRLVRSSRANQQVAPVKNTHLHLLEGHKRIVVTMHVYVDQIAVIYKENRHQLCLNLADGAYKRCTMSLSFVCVEDSDANNSPSCWCSPVSLAKALVFDLYLRPSKVR
jgi:hypothetical protein